MTGDILSMNENKAIYGIIGFPLKHSLSPVMHNTAFDALEVDAVYEKFELQENELKDFFAGLRKKNSPIFGLNVTIPYKEKVLEYLDSVTPLVERIQAVNTIVITNQRKLIGYNTDAPGFLAHLAELKVSLKEKNVAILGSGGTTRAILATMCMIPDRPNEITIYNRTASKLKQLIDSLGQRVDLSIVRVVDSLDDLRLEKSDILINTTSVGLDKKDESLINEELLHSDLFVYDIIYSPKETALLKMAKRKGAKVANGLGMLFYQGVLSFEHWANVLLEDELKNKMRKSLEKAVI